MGDALNEHSGRCREGLAVPLRTDLSTGSKRGATGRKPARIASDTGLVDRSRRYHEVSILIAVGGGPRRCFGWQPLAKVSMMIMRPPQQRHGRGSTRGPSAAAVVDVSACFGRDGTASNSRARAMLAARLPLANNP